MKKKVLVIDDDADMCILLNRFLKKNDFDVDSATTSFSGMEKFKIQKPDIVLCDYRLEDGKNGKDVLLEIKKLRPETIVIIITGYSDIKIAVDVIRMGAVDYITKPLVPDEVLNVVNQALANLTTKRSFSQTIQPKEKESIIDHEYLIGTASTTKELNKRMEMAASTDHRIVLYGESGTGKKIIAKTIHDKSNRKEKPFVLVDCNTLLKDSSQKELFGFRDDNGAIEKGYFELANGGTLFLDEAGCLSLEAQSAILKIILEKKMGRYGFEGEIDMDIRIIVSSIDNLQEKVLEGNFLEELYHRLNEFSIYIPPLRERKEDIPLFANFFLNKTKGELNKEIDPFDDEIQSMFMNYSWPGNLREFKNTIRRAVLLSDNNKISAGNLSPLISNSAVVDQHVK